MAFFYSQDFSPTTWREKITEQAAKQAEKQTNEVEVATVVEEPLEEELILTGAGLMTAEQAAADFPLTMTEADVMDAIHWMSHQKVRAERKEGALRITPERIARLIEVVEANAYPQQETFLTILHAWKVEDYQKVDQHHNWIWSLKEGSVGKAYGILSRAEEQEFIEENF